MEFNLSSITNAISIAFTLMSSWEILAVVLGIIYVILAAKESLWAWFFGFLGTLIYTVLFWEGALVSSALLNFYYMLMAIYGFVLWRGGKSREPLTITTYQRNQHIVIIGIGLLLCATTGYISTTYLEAKFAYLDSFIMTFSVIATWMLANKVLENWLYWMVVDTAGTYLYFKSEYYATVVLFTLYVLLAFYGFYTWRKEYREL